jgi:Acetyltransferase (GNAT) domain
MQVVMGISQQLSWEVVPITQRSRALSRWRALHARLAGCILISAEAIDTALAHFGVGDERIAFGARGGVDCTAILLRAPLRGVVNIFLPSQLPLAPILNPRDHPLNAGDLRALIAAMSLSGVVLRVSCLDSLWGSDFEKVRGIEKTVLLNTPSIELPSTLEVYMSERANKFRSDLRRRRKKAESEKGPIRFTELTQPGEIAASVAQYGTLESRGWKGAAGTAVTAEGAQFRFYEDWLAQRTALGEARVFTLHIGDTIAAMRLAIQQGDCLYMLKVTYEESLRAYSPGALMLESLIEWCYSEKANVRRIEFYGKTAEAHQPWLTSIRPICTASIYRFEWLGVLRAERKRRIQLKKDMLESVVRQTPEIVE